MPRTLTRKHIVLTAAVTALTACGGGGAPDATSGTPVAKAGSYIYYGTVPGTLIEAFCDNGAYYSTQSHDNGTDQHPFELELPAGLACNLVMTTNEDDPENSVTTPIAYLDANGELSSRARAGDGIVIDLGNIPLYTDRDDAAGADLDGDGILDQPLALGSPNNLVVEIHAGGSTLDPDGDNIVEYYDDEDDDGIPNHADPDYTRRATDRDGDGLDDDVDVNPDNDPNADNSYPEAMDHDRDGYLDEDGDHNGYYDDDTDQDGFHDDDMNHDGFHDSDHDHDGFRDSSNGDDVYGEFAGTVESIDAETFSLRITRSNTADVGVGDLIEIDASQARFEHDGTSQIQSGDLLEVKGRWDGVTLLAFKVSTDDGADTPDDDAADDMDSDAGGMDADDMESDSDGMDVDDAEDSPDSSDDAMDNESDDDASGDMEDSDDSMDDGDETDDDGMDDVPTGAGSI